MNALVAALSASKRPASWSAPGVDRAQAVDLMLRLAEKARASVWGQPVLGALQFPGAASAVRWLPSGFASAALGCIARP